MIPREQCYGCHDDFYNAGDARCWSAKTGRMKIRYQLHFMQVPTEKGAYKKVRRPSCFHKVNSYVFHDRLPDFVKLSDVVRSKS
jgi:hypothetical protein